MNAELLLRAIGEQQVAGFMLVLGRVSPLFLLAPLFSSPSIPRRAKGIAALGISVGMAPVALRGGELPMTAMGLGGLMVKEVLVGLAFAFALGAVMAAVMLAGSILDNLVGYSFGALIDPLTGVQNAVLAQMYGLVAVMIFIAIGGDAWVIEGLARTYELVPLTSLPDMAALAGGVVTASGTILVAAVEVAAPVMLACVLTDAGFGLISRAVPQLNVFAVGFPAKLIVALLVLVASLPFVGGYIADAMRDGVRDAMSIVGAAG